MSSKNPSLRRFLFILILPLTILITSFFLRMASGSFWQYSDPCYIYLFNAFQIVKGHPPTDFSHPGTPLQVLIAMTIRIFNGGRPAAEAVNQALINPEFYLGAVYIFLILTSFATSILLGLYVYRKTNDKLAILLAQLPGLCFLIMPSFDNGGIASLPVVANVSPEPLFISIMNLFNLCLLGLYFSQKKSKELRYIILLAFVCGLGLATKLNFFFVLLTALMIISYQRKLLFIVAGMMSFILFTLPIVEKYPQFIQLISDTIGHAGRYGMGDPKIIDWSSIVIYLNVLIHYYWFFILSALGLWVWSSIRLFKDRQNRNACFIWALSCCFLLHILATAKYFSFHYLLPALGLFSSIFVLFYLDQKTLYKIISPLTAVFILIFISVCIFNTIPYYNKLMVLSEDIHHFNDTISSQYPSCTIIPSTTANINLFINEQEALHRADGTVFRLEAEDLYRLYPKSYYFYTEEVTSVDVMESYGIWDYKQRVAGDDIMATCPCAIFIKYTSDFSVYPYQVRLVGQSKYLNAYLLVNSTEKEANDLFEQTINSVKSGNYQQALITGLKSRELNYEPRNQLDFILAIILSNLKQ